MKLSEDVKQQIQLASQGNMAALDLTVIDRARALEEKVQLNKKETAIELGHQIRDMAEELQVQTGVLPQWILCSRDIEPNVRAAVSAACLSLGVYGRDDMLAQNLQMGSGDMP